jgi:hypothetical protein
MFRDIMKLGLRTSVNTGFWKTPTRMQESIKLNSKPHIEINYLQAMKPPLPLKPQEPGPKAKELLQD